MMIWFVLAAAVLIVELFAGTVYLLVVSTALFGAGAAAWFSDGTAVPLTVAAVLAALGIWLVHGRLKNRTAAEDIQNRVGDLDIGQTVRIVRRLHGDRYEVFYRGTHWQARLTGSHAAEAGATAVITGKNGNLLIVGFPPSSSD